MFFLLNVFVHSKRDLVPGIIEHDHRSRSDAGATDQGSWQGTFVDSRQLEGRARIVSGSWIRVGLDVVLVPLGLG